MITSNLARAGYPGRVTVKFGSGSAKESGMLMDSVVTTDNLATIRHSEIDRVIGMFAAMKEIDAALRTTLAL
jgi:mRNA-degrading endonuclease toxin of MazEF toxin-antitoxin module